MALMRCEFFSDVLGLSTSMTVILPESTTRQIGMSGERDSQPPPVLYLLHGLSDDDTTWSRRTSIERYAAGLGLAVVMPAVHHSFYTDEAHGLPFWTFLTEELPSVVQRFFRVSSAREDTFVAGLSMGGYGAMKWALREPWRFAAAASLSGALALAHPSESPDPDFTRLMDRVFGDRSTPGTDDDLLHLVRRADPSALPALFVACGTEDFLYPAARAFLAAAGDGGVEVTADIGPGDHDWDYWDAHIQDVLRWLPVRR
ncbi:MAG: esterase family protein [Actinobacteria bacterium]|jgi:S-formylglutathione hydrolase FrmB|nr:esterase family protein [Actinomycetota bacterium]